MDVSIILVNYNTCDLILQCLQSVYEKTNGIDFEVIVVDNASSDKSTEMIRRQYPQVQVIENSENLGFGRANNLGAEYAKGKYLFLLNSDTILIDNIILEFYRFMQETPNIAACGANLLDSNRNLTICHGKFPSLLQEFSDIGFHKLYHNWYKNNLSLGQKATEGTVDHVEYLSGADIFIRRNVFMSLGGFDSGFFMYYEETDLFFRMHKLGYNVCLLPHLCIIHLEGASFDKSKKVNIDKICMQFKSKVLYYKRNKAKGAVFFMKLFSLLFFIARPHVYGKYLSTICKAIIITQ